MSEYIPRKALTKKQQEQVRTSTIDLLVTMGFKWKEGYLWFQFSCRCRICVRPPTKLTRSWCFQTWFPDCSKFAMFDASNSMTVGAEWTMPLRVLQIVYERIYREGYLTGHKSGLAEGSHGERKRLRDFIDS